MQVLKIVSTDWLCVEILEALNSFRAILSINLVQQLHTKNILQDKFWSCLLAYNYEPNKCAFYVQYIFAH